MSYARPPTRASIPTRSSANSAMTPRRSRLCARRVSSEAGGLPRLVIRQMRQMGSESISGEIDSDPILPFDHFERVAPPGWAAGGGRSASDALRLIGRPRLTAAAIGHELVE